MTAPDGRIPRPRSWNDGPFRRPATGSRSKNAWFAYAAGDEIVWSEALAAMLGQAPNKNEVSRQILARFVHRDDRARALGAITRAWSTREPVATTVRLVRADGAWFDVDCHLEPIADPDGTVRGIRGTVTDVSVRERARREVARLARRGETVQTSVTDPDPATGLLTRAGFADELDRALRRGAGAVLVIRVEPDRTPFRGRVLARPEDRRR